MTRPLTSMLIVTLLSGAATILCGCPFQGGQGQPLPNQPGAVTTTAGPFGLTADKQTLLIADTTQLNSTAPKGASLSYSSTAPGVATVDAKGVVTAVNVGTTTIKATWGNQSATLAIRVITGASTELLQVDSIDVQPGSQTVNQVGAQLVFSAVCRDTSKNAIPGIKVYWFSSNPAVATITPGGVLTVVGAGSTEVTASAGDKKSGASVITVPGGSVNVNVDFGAN